jgi:hypothetical protein
MPFLMQREGPRQMVDLPTVPDRIVTSTAPQSSVSRGDIIGSNNLMAKAIGDVADATMDIATRQAKEQAATDLQNQKVTRDADGNVTVANPANSIIFGRAGEAYHAAVQAGTIAQHSNVISSEMNDIHQKFPTDPAAFNTAADAWKSKYLQDHGGGQVGEAISQQADQVHTQHSMAITNTAGNIDLKKQDGALSASQTSAQDDVFAMLRGGANLADPAVQSRIAQVDSTIAARAANPLFAYSKEQAQLDRESFHSEAGASRWLYDVDTTYKNQGDGGGYAGAMAKAQDILSNPGYKLSQAQREQYYHRATAEIHTNEALRRQDVAEVRAGFSDLMMQSATGGRVDSDQVEHLGKAADAAGDPGLKARIFASFIRKPLNDTFGQQPIPQMTQQIAAMDGVHAASFVNSALIAKGYSPIAAAGIVGNTIHESGVNPYSSGDSGTSGGIAQFHNERLTALKAFAAAAGKPATDLQTQVDFIDHELHTTETGTLAKLQAAKTPEQAGAAFIDYERPQGWTPENPAGGLGYESRQKQARAVFDGKPADMSLGPAGSAWLIQNRKNTLDDAATKQWQTVMKDYNSTESSTLPSLKTVNDIVDAARMANNSVLLEQIGHDTQRMDLAHTGAQKPLGEQDTAIATMQAAGASGNLSPGDAAQMKDLMRRRDAIVSGTAKDPVATTVANFSNVIKEPPPLDMSSDDKLAQGLQLRGKIVQFAADRWKTPALSALDSGEVKQVQAVLASPDPAVKVRIFRAIGTLPEDVRGATLAKLGETGPLAATEVFAGSLLQQAPEVGASILTGLHAQDDKDVYSRLVPSKDAAGKTYQTAKDTVLPIAAFNLPARTNPTGAYAVMSSAIDARYAALSAQAGDTSGNMDRKRLERSAEDVTGGILYHGGAPLVAPARGMKQSEFDGVMAGITDADMAGVATGKGAPITADYLRNSAKLHSLSTGRYLVQINTDDANPKYAAGPGGGPFVLDLRNRPQAPIAPMVLPQEMASPS